MTSPTSTGGGRHWAQINEASFVGGMRLMFWIFRVFGNWPFRIMLYPVVAWYVLTQAAARHASNTYLQRVSAYDPASNIRLGKLTVLRHFAAFAESILDKMLLWGGLFNADKVRFFGHETVVARIDQQRGGLMVCSHLGNLELCRVLSRRRAGLKLTVLVHTRHAQAFNRMLAKLDPRSQLNLMQVTEISPVTAMMLSERIERGEFIVIAGDRIPVSPSPRTVPASFMGKPAPFPIGPYVLASLLQCPVYLLFSTRRGDNYELHFELFEESIRLPRKEREEALTGLAAKYAARLEHFCLTAPLQWFNFYDFWHLPTMDKSDASR